MESLLLHPSLCGCEIFTVHLWRTLQQYCLQAESHRILQQPCKRQLPPISTRSIILTLLHSHIQQCCIPVDSGELGCMKSGIRVASTCSSTEQDSHKQSWVEYISSANLDEHVIQPPTRNKSSNWLQHIMGIPSSRTLQRISAHLTAIVATGITGPDSFVLIAPSVNGDSIKPVLQCIALCPCPCPCPCPCLRVRASFVMRLLPCVFWTESYKSQPSHTEPAHGPVL